MNPPPPFFHPACQVATPTREAPALTHRGCSGRSTGSAGENLSHSQRRALDFLRGYVQAHGYAPSTREIKDALGHASQTAAVSMLRTLARKGAIRVSPRKARAIVIL